MNRTWLKNLTEEYEKARARRETPRETVKKKNINNYKKDVEEIRQNIDRAYLTIHSVLFGFQNDLMELGYSCALDDIEMPVGSLGFSIPSKVVLLLDPERQPEGFSTLDDADHIAFKTIDYFTIQVVFHCKGEDRYSNYLAIDENFSSAKIEDMVTRFLNMAFSPAKHAARE